MAFQYHTWLLYPAALGTLVLSKSFVVLKAAVTPRVLPPAITLVTTNSRLTTFGLAAGGVFGGIAAGVAWLWGSQGALLFTALLAVAGTVLCLRIPRWVESTAGEVPAALRATAPGQAQPDGPQRRGRAVGQRRDPRAHRLPHAVRRVRRQGQTDAEPTAAAPAHRHRRRRGGHRLVRAATRRVHGRGRCPSVVVLWCVGAAVAVAVVAAAVPGIATAAVVGLVGAAASALAKVSLDAVIQRDLPEESRASAFGRSETVLQLAWVSAARWACCCRTTRSGSASRWWRASSRWSGCRPCCCSRGRSIAPFLAVKDRPVAPTVPGGLRAVLGWAGASPSSSCCAAGRVARRVRRRPPRPR